jgi:hypothetical protein
MKKLTYLFFLILAVSCYSDDELIQDELTVVPEELMIPEIQGIKLASQLVDEEVSINVKLPEAGTYRVKIRHSMTDRLVSQEELVGKQGDNLLKIYVRTLPISSYKIELVSSNNKVIGVETFGIKSY